MSHRSVLFAACLAALAVGAVYVGFFHRGRGPDPRLSPAAGDRLTALSADLEDRFARVEERIERIAGAGRAAVDTGAEDSSGYGTLAGAATPPGAPSDGSRVGEGEEGTDARIAKLEARVRDLETRMQVQGEDPVLRGYAYVGSASRELRLQGLDILQKLAASDPEARAAIRGLLQDPDPKVRDRALQALAKVQDTDALPEVLGLLSDAEPRLRVGAIEAARDLLRDRPPDSPEVQAAAAAIVERLSDPDVKVRRNAAEALGDLRSGESLGALVDTLADQHDAVRREAIVSLGRLGDPAAVPHIEKVHAEGGESAWDAAVALRRLGREGPWQQETARLSRVATQGATEEERRDAVRTLGRHAEESLRPIFMEALDDPSPRVRDQAEEALRDLKK